MRKIKKGNIIYLIPKQPDTMDLKCSNCGLVKHQ